MSYDPFDGSTLLTTGWRSLPLRANPSTRFHYSMVAQGQQWLFAFHEPPPRLLFLLDFFLPGTRYNRLWRSEKLGVRSEKVTSA